MTRCSSPSGRALTVAIVGASAIPALVLADGWWTWLDAGRPPLTGAHGVQFGVGLGLLSVLATALALPAARRALARSARPVLAFVVSLSLSLVVGELILLRVASGPGFHLRMPGAIYEFTPDPYVLPGAKGVARYSVNARGLRGAEIPDAPGVFKILCVGGGSTECLYVDDAECWPLLAQAELQRRGLSSVWVGAAGHADFAAAEHAEFLRTSPLVDRVDCVLCQVGVNDLLRLFLGESLEQAPLTLLQRTAISRSVAGLWRFVSPRGLRVDPDGRGLVEGRLAIPFEPREIDLELAVDQFGGRVRHMIELARGRGVEIVFVTQPVLWEDFPRPAAADVLRYARLKPEPRDWSLLSPAACRAAIDRYNALVIEIGGEEGVPVIDAAAVNGLENCYFDDCHLNRLGCSDLATIIADWFYQRLTKTATVRPGATPGAPDRPGNNSPYSPTVDASLTVAEIAARPARALLVRRQLDEAVRLAADETARAQAIAKRDALDRLFAESGLLDDSGEPTFQREPFGSPAVAGGMPSATKNAPPEPPPEPPGPWTLSVSGDDVVEIFRARAGGDQVRIQFPKTDSLDQWRIQLQWPNADVSSSKRYQVSFRARADAPRSIVAVCAQAEPPFDVLGLWQEVKLDSDWRTFRLSFIPTRDEAKARCQFYLGGSPVPVEIADFAFGLGEDAPAPAWTLVVGTGARAEQAQTTSGEQRINILEPGSDPFAIQLRGGEQVIEAHHAYRVRFRARADMPRKAICVLTEASSPWENLGLYSELEFIPEWREFTLDVTSTKAAKAALFLNLGGSVVSVEISEAMFEPMPTAASLSPPSEK